MASRRRPHKAVFVMASQMGSKISNGKKFSSILRAAMLASSIGTLQVSRPRVIASADRPTVAVSGVFSDLCLHLFVLADKVHRMDQLPTGQFPGVQVHGPIPWIHQRLFRRKAQYHPRGILGYPSSHCRTQNFRQLVSTELSLHLGHCQARPQHLAKQACSTPVPRTTNKRRLSAFS